MAIMSIAEALREAIREEMRRDERVFCLGEDIDVEGGFGGAFTVTLGLSKEFGHERILDTPISEIMIAGAAVGAAMTGMIPIADVQYNDFLFCMMDQLANNAAKMTYMSGGTIKVPMVMRAPVGASTRGAQHAQSLEGFFTHVPGLKIICPSTAYDAKGLLKTAIRDDNPVLVFALFLLIILFAPVLAKKAKIPGIIGLIVAGILIGPHGLDLISKELNNNYSAININYKEQLKGITKSFEKFKIQTNSTSSWSYNALNTNQQVAIFELSEQVEKIIDNTINEVYG